MAAATPADYSPEEKGRASERAREMERETRTLLERTGDGLGSAESERRERETDELERGWRRRPPKMADPIKRL